MKEVSAEFVSDEEAKKLKQFDSLEELLATAKDTGIELGEDILEQVAGGMSDSERKALYKIFLAQDAEPSGPPSVSKASVLRILAN